MNGLIGANIKLLRKRRGRTQDDIASALELKRPTLSGYENGVAEPPLQTLIAIARYFKISVDTLITVDLSALRESQIRQIEMGNDMFVSGGNLRVLATTVDSRNVENIEVVNQKASAGYRTGFADPEYIRVLPTFQMPFLSPERKYRTFQISGDSMLPIPDRSWVTGEFVQNWNQVRDGQAYIVLTMEDGILFKVVENRADTEGRFILHSLNTYYDPYPVEVKDIREVWKFVHYISAEMPEPNLMQGNLDAKVSSLKNEVEKIKLQLRQGKLFG